MSEKSNDYLQNISDGHRSRRTSIDTWEQTGRTAHRTEAVSVRERSPRSGRERPPGGDRSAYLRDGSAQTIRGDRSAYPRDGSAQTIRGDRSAGYRDWSAQTSRGERSVNSMDRSAQYSRGDKSVYPRSGRAGNSRVGRDRIAQADRGMTALRERDSSPVQSSGRGGDGDPSTQRRRQRRELQRVRRAQAVRRQKIFLAVAAVAAFLLIVTGTRLVRRAWAKSTLSDAVLGYRSTVESYARKEKVEDYVDTLLAIMMVESEGTGSDVMQSSESKGLAINSLSPEESIEQACIYFAALRKIADDLGIKDDKALIQAYNFGPGYLNYIAERGGRHQQEYAIEYAKEQSGGEKVRYLHLYAIRENGGWIYKFGNMFYNAIVQKYL